MTPRTRDTWLLIAGLPGLAAPFVPFISWIFGSELSLVDVLLFENEYALLVLPGFLPLFIVPWQLRRLITGRDGDAWLAVAWILAFIATAASMLGNLYMLAPSARWQDSAVLVGPIVATVGLFLYGRWRGVSPGAVAESFLLGTYVATVSPHILVLIADDVDLIGPWLAAWTCLVYLATIVIRLRASERSRSSIL
jgi:hypothetical protein